MTLSGKHILKAASIAVLAIMAAWSAHAGLEWSGMSRAFADDAPLSLTVVAEGGSVNVTCPGGEATEVSDGEERSFQACSGDVFRVEGQCSSDGLACVAVLDAGGTPVEDPARFAHGAFFRDVTMTGIPKRVEARINSEDAPLFTTLNAGSESQPEVGDVFWGEATTCGVCTNSYGGLEFAEVSVDTGICAELGVVTTYCADHTAAAPYEGQDLEYRFTVTSVDKAAGLVTGEFYAIPVDYPTDGVTTTDGKHLAGYQRLSCTQIIRRTYGGYIELYKASSDPSITSGHPCYSLEGAVYGIYSDAECTNLEATLSTDAAGHAGPSEYVNAGEHWVREISAPRGYALSGDVRSVNVAGGTELVWFADHPIESTGPFVVSKHDSELGWRQENNPLGGARLEGAVYCIEYYRAYHSTFDAARASGAPARTWRFKTDAHGRIDLARADACLASGVLYRTASGSAAFPLGTYLVYEAASPDGYFKSSGRYLARVEQSGSSAVVSGNVKALGGCMQVTDAEQAKRGDLSFTKVREADMARLAGVPFRLTSETTGEWHVLVTDDNGHVDTASSWNAHSANTNRNDAAGSPQGGSAAALDPDCGIWFGAAKSGSAAPVKDSLGALPYDTYRLDELPCKANEGVSLVSIAGISIRRNAVTVDLGTIDDRSDAGPAIHTSARDGADLDKCISADVSNTVVDHVEFMNLVPGELYTLSASLVDPDTEVPLDGASSSLEFSPTTSSGSVDVPMQADLLDVQSSRLVVFEELSCRGTVVASHKDAEDAEQSVIIAHPEISTMASDEMDGDKTVISDSESAIVDEVLYSGLSPDAEYRIEGQIVMVRPESEEDGEISWEPLEGGVSEVVFSPERESGSVEVEIPIDTSNLEPGCTLVAFERLYRGERLVASHEDATDEGQSVHIESSSVDTYAFDSHDGDKEVSAQAGSEVTDRIRLSNILPGRRYMLHGVVIDRETGLPAVSRIEGREAGGSGIEGLDSAPSGEEVAEFWEELLEMLGITQEDTGSGITCHADPAHIFDPEELDALLEAHGAILERMSTVSEPFDADTAKDVATVSYRFDATGMSGSYVIYDMLTSNGKVVSLHADSGNEMQAFEVSPPKIATEAMDATDGDHVLLPSMDAKVVDCVRYEGLLSGCEYTLCGILMDASTGDPIYVEDKPVESSRSFVPSTSRGSVNVEFSFDASQFPEEAKVVAYEYLLKDGDTVAEHADFGDELQTIEICATPSGASFHKTGAAPPSRRAAIVLLALGGVFALSGAALRAKSRRKIASGGVRGGAG